MFNREYIKKLNAQLRCLELPDWTKWNNIEVIFEKQIPTQVCVNNKNYTQNRQVRCYILNKLKLETDRIIFIYGKDTSMSIMLPNPMPPCFRVGFFYQTRKRIPLYDDLYVI